MCTTYYSICTIALALFVCMYYCISVCVPLPLHLCVCIIALVQARHTQSERHFPVSREPVQEEGELCNHLRRRVYPLPKNQRCPFLWKWYVSSVCSTPTFSAAISNVMFYMYVCCYFYLLVVTFVIWRIKCLLLAGVDCLNLAQVKQINTYYSTTYSHICNMYIHTVCK